MILGRKVHNPVSPQIFVSDKIHPILHFKCKSDVFYIFHFSIFNNCIFLKLFRKSKRTLFYLFLHQQTSR